MLDLVVLIAMAVTAAAFAVGLIIQSGIAQIPPGFAPTPGLIRALT